MQLMYLILPQRYTQHPLMPPGYDLTPKPEPNPNPNPHDQVQQPARDVLVLDSVHFRVHLLHRAALRRHAPWDKLGVY